MFKPEEQQVEICLLKSNLEEIGNELVVQRSALPALDAENEQKYRETMTALRVTRSLNIEIERLKLENVRLTAKRMQLKRQSDDIGKRLERARENRRELTELLKQEKLEMELQIRQYEDALAEIAERFRATRGFYNKEETDEKTEQVNKVITELKSELDKRQNMVDDLNQQLNELQPAIPEDFLTIMGKVDLNEKIKELEGKYDAVHQKYNLIINKKNNLVTSMLQFISL